MKINCGTNKTIYNNNDEIIPSSTSVGNWFTGRSLVLPNTILIFLIKTLNKMIITQRVPLFLHFYESWKLLLFSKHSSPFVSKLFLFVPLGTRQKHPFSSSFSIEPSCCSSLFCLPTSTKLFHV